MARGRTWLAERTGSRLDLRKSARDRTLFGALLGALALGLGWLFVSGRFHAPDGGPAPAWVGTLCVGLIGLCSLGLLLFRGGIRVNRPSGLVTTWWGFPRAWSKRERRLEEFRSVHLLKVVRRTGNNQSATYYVVRLGGEEPWDLADSKDPLYSRRLGEVLARELNLPLHNEISGIPVIRPPDQLDWSLGRRLRASGAAPPLPEAPPNSKVGVDVTEQSLRVSIPSAGLMRGGLVLLALVVPGASIGLALTFGMTTGSPLAFRIGMMGFVSLPILLVLAVALVRGTRRFSLELSPETICVNAIFPWGRFRRRLSIDEIEELTVTDPKARPALLAGLLALGGITLTTDQALVFFGNALDDLDRAFVADLIRHVLCRGHRVANEGPNPSPSGELLSV